MPMTTFQRIISVSLLLITISIGYYFIFFLPKQKIEEKAQKENQQQINNKLLQNCLDEINTKIKKTFVGSISSGTRNTLLDYFQKEEDNCFKRYPIK